MKEKEEKIIIDNLGDLLKIPFSKLSHAKFSNFSGKYFEKIYKDTITLIENECFNNNKIQINSENNSEINNSKDISNNNSLININVINNNLNKEENLNFNIININNESNEDMNNNILNKGDFPLKKITFEINYKTKFGEEIGILGNIEYLGNWNTNKVFKLKWANENLWVGSIHINEDNLIDFSFEFKFILLYHNKIIKWQSGINNIFSFNDIYQKLILQKNGKYSKYSYKYLDEELILNCKWV
jgi:hypothetical protein